ncbi:MAG: efflux RND transporter periplasmic adaptor subunit [Woeseiaceae bacterium]|nr:efflux RND transporter periplasmic adaptor subunit [Woeseiaceae bacterium]
MTQPRSPLRPVAAGLTALLLLVACSQEVEERAPVIRPVKIQTVASFEGGVSLNYSGAVRAAETADLSFEVPGRIIELPITEGQDVSRGDLVARLDPADFQQSVNQARATYTAAEAEFKRFEELVKTGAVARRQVDVKRRDYEVAAAQLEQARKALADTRLTAPFDGQIGRRLVDNFTNVQAKQAIAVLQDMTGFEVVVTVPEQDWGRARPGLTMAERNDLVDATVAMSAVPDRQIPLIVTEVSSVADPVTRTFEVTGRFDPPDDIQVLPGMSASVSVTVPAELSDRVPEIMLPTAAVLADDDGNTTIWLVDPNSMQVSRAAVELGEISGAEVEIRSGVKAGDRVAVSGVHALREGMTVRELTN